MPTFRYKARNKTTQKLIVDHIDAKGEKEAIKKLRDKDLLILSIGPDYATQLAIPFLNRVSQRDRILFTRELAVMVKAGLPLLQALKALHEQTANGILKKTITSLVKEVEGGSSLSDAFSKHPTIFPPIFVSVTRSGEKSGKLEEVLERLANQIENDYDLISKIRGAMIYPVFVLFALVAVIILIMVYIIPQLKTLFEDVDVPLPLITRTLLAISGFMSKYILGIILVVIALIIGFRFANQRPKVRKLVEKIYFRLPIFGKLYRKVLMTRFSHTLATMLASGLPMIEAIKTTGEVMGSPNYNDSIRTMASSIENGQPLSATLLADKQFPPMIGHMVAIGESSGKIDEVLMTVGAFFEKEVENLTRNLSALLEPLLMVMMGIGVGLVVASVIVPMYNLVNAV